MRQQRACVIDESFMVTEGYLNKETEVHFKYIYKSPLGQWTKRSVFLPFEISIIYKCCPPFSDSVDLELSRRTCFSDFIVKSFKIEMFYSLFGESGGNHTRKGAKSQCGRGNPATPAGKRRGCVNEKIKAYRGQ